MYSKVFFVLITFVLNLLYFCGKSAQSKRLRIMFYSQSCFREKQISLSILLSKKFKQLKEAASKPWRKGGVNTLSNKKCFMGPTVLIQSALDFPDVGQCFTYPERVRTMRRKFSTGF